MGCKKMNKKFIAHCLFWVFVISMIIATIFGAAQGYSLNHSEDYVFFYNYSLNNCSDNTTTNISLNQTFSCPMCTNTTQYVCNEIYNFTIDLQAGESIDTSHENCHYVASCEPESNDVEPVCIIQDVLIDAGDNYYYKKGACEVEIECRECQDPDIKREEKYVDYTFEYDDSKKSVVASLGDQRLAFSTNESTYVKTGQMVFACPSLEESDCLSSLNSDDAFSFCRKYDPLSSFIPVTLNKSLDAMSAYQKLTDEFRDKSLVDIEQLNQCVVNLASCQASYNTSSNNQNIMLSDEQSRLAVCSAKLDSFKFGTAILSILCFVLLMLVILLLLMRRIQGGEVL